jgi:molybdenum cofactor cytidylyltransferase
MGCILKGGGGLYSRLVVSSIVLAAGAGSRLGYRPKSLLELGGVPLIRRQLIALSGAGVDQVVVVLGHHAQAIEPVIQDFPVTIVHNTQPDDGQVSSLRLGLQAISGKVDATLVTLADLALLNAQDITDLIAAYKKRPQGTQVVIPTHDDLPGNPVIFDNEVRESILQGGAHVGCKQWQSQHPEAVHRWATTNRRYRLDIDSAGDIDQLAQTTGHQLRWPAAFRTENATS